MLSLPKNLIVSLLIIQMAITAKAKTAKDDTLTAINSLPRDAREVLNTFPEKALTVPLVLVRAMQKSDDFKLVEAEKEKIPANLLSAEGALDTKITIEAQKFNNENEPGNTFQPSSMKGEGYGVKAERQFSTGTGVEFSVKQGYNDTSFQTIVVDPYYDSSISLGLSQDLVKNGFGYSLRRKLEAGRLASEAQAFQAHEAIDQWSLALIERFYRAWLYQRQADVARESHARRERLLKVTELRLQRGTAERQDLLQVKSAWLQDKNRVDQTQNLMENEWRELVIKLKLPVEWTSIDPKYIPLKIDESHIHAGKICQDFNKKGIPRSSAKLQKQNRLSSAAKLLKEAAYNELYPSLKLYGSYTVNGVDENQSTSVSDATSKDYPAWAIGVTFSMPIGLNTEKSNFITASANQLAAQAQLDGAYSQQNISWLNLCKEHQRLLTAVDRSEDAYNNQLQRQKLEERQFSIGRTTTLVVIQAGDDSAQAEINWHNNKAELRSISWQILALAGVIPDTLKEFAKNLQKDKDEGSLK